MFSSGGNKSYVTKILSKKGALVFVRVQADELGIWLVIIEREKGKGQLKSSPGHQQLWLGRKWKFWEEFSGI